MNVGIRTIGILCGWFLLSQTTLAKDGRNNRPGKNNPQTQFQMGWNTTPFLGDPKKDFPGLVQYLINDSGINSENGYCDWIQEFDLSSDGSKVTFSASMNRNVQQIGGFIKACQVVVLELKSGRVEIVSINDRKWPGNEDSRSPKFSPDGNYIYFHSFATNFPLGIVGSRQTNPVDEIGTMHPFLYSVNLTTREIKVVNTLEDGRSYDPYRPGWDIGGEGQTLFMSNYSRLVAKNLVNNTFKTYLSKPGQLSSMAVKRDVARSEVVVCKSSETVLLNLQTGESKILAAVPCGNKDVKYPNGDWVFVGNLGGKIKGINVNTMEVKIANVDNEGNEKIDDSHTLGMAFSSDGEWIAYSDSTSSYRKLPSDFPVDAYGVFLRNLKTGELRFIENWTE